MKEIISKKLDERWNNLVMDGTKPPVKSCLRKQLHYLMKNKPAHVITTTNATTDSNMPLVIVLFFEEGGIPIDPSRTRLRNVNEDNVFTLTEFHNQISNDQLLSDKSVNGEGLNDGMGTMTLTNNSPPLAANQAVADDKSPLRNGLLMSNVLSSLDNRIVDNPSIDDHLDDGDLIDDHLVKLREENELMMKSFDERIDRFQTKIKKTITQLKQMDHGLKQLKIEKEKKQSEFIALINEQKRINKTKKLNQDRRKSVKRIKSAIGDGEN